MYLNCHTYHSLRYGTISVEELVQTAVELGIQELVLTDINTITAIYDFKKECEKFNIKPIAGVEIRKENKLLYIAIAQCFEGIAEINQLLTNYNCYGGDLPETAPEFNNVWIIYPLEKAPEQLKQNEFIGVLPQKINLLVRPEYQKRMAKMVIWQPVTFKTKKGHNLHRVLRSIDQNTLVSKLLPEECCAKTEYFIAPEKIGCAV